MGQGREWEVWRMTIMKSLCGLPAASARVVPAADGAGVLGYSRDAGMEPGCWDTAGMLGYSRDAGMLVLGYFAVPPAGPAPARVEISTLQSRSQLL